MGTKVKENYPLISARARKIGGPRENLSRGGANYWGEKGVLNLPEGREKRVNWSRQKIRNQATETTNTVTSAKKAGVKNVATSELRESPYNLPKLGGKTLATGPKCRGKQGALKRKLPG